MHCQILSIRTSKRYTQERTKMNLNIKQLPYGSDNFAYILYGNKEAMAIDGGAWQEILAFVNQENLSLTIVANTHAHFDHTSGNDHLLRQTTAHFIPANNFQDNQAMTVDGQSVLVYRTPGHTADSVCFHSGKHLITGDTLFNGTIGNCFSGNMQGFYRSIKRLMGLPDNTRIYAGHDYVSDALAFASRLEPDNPNINIFLEAYSRRLPAYSTLVEERNVNPYLRFNEQSIIQMLQEKNLPCSSEEDRWSSLMSID